MSALGPIEPDAIVRTVSGRPTGYAGEENERRWKTAVRNAFAGATLPESAPVCIEVEFVLAPDQRGRREPDLDNLIKSTVDALEGVLGQRPGTGERVEADDVRVVRIVASKRHGLDPEDPGARITVSTSPSVPNSSTQERA